MKKLVKVTAIILMGLMPFLSFSQFNPTQDDGKYKVKIDLTNTVDERVKVEFVVPIIMDKEVVYNMPRMVPGTYKVYNFGRFVNNLVAIGGRGDTLKVEKLNANQWKINEANKLYKIVYWADDTYNENGKDVFAPAGTDFNTDVNLLNSFSFIGYLEGYKDLPYEYNIVKPEGFFGSTSLDLLSSENGVDVFEAQDYFELHDCPILYAKPDTASVNVVGTKVSIAVFSPKGNLSAKEIMDSVAPVFLAAADYLGGDLPAEKYTVLIYGMDLKQAMMGIGALEHHTSTVVNVPDISDQYMRMFSEGGMTQLLRDIISHEFFHIVTPLNIHSKEIADYDFMNPQMSKHLWLYEGVTEYNANISQVRSGVITEEQFIANIKSKMTSDHSFNSSIPFTVASKFALSYFEDQYANVYEKGALIGMCLDLTLRENSNGEYGLPNLLMELSATYGKDTFFVDDQLFDIITAQVGNEDLREFFARYVEGAESLPYRELLAKVGYNYQTERITRSISDGGLTFSVVDDLVVVKSYRRQDVFRKGLGIKRRDVLVSWNGVKINANNYEEILKYFVANSKAGETINVVVKRQVEGKDKKLKLQTTSIIYDQKEIDVIEPMGNPSDLQLNLKKAWMNN